MCTIETTARTAIKLLGTTLAQIADACGRSQTTSLPARQQPRSTARLLLLHLHSDEAMNTPMIVTLTVSDTAYHFSYLVQDWLEDLNARLAYARARRAASA